MITVTGIGSGLDIESLVSQLVEAERSPAESRLLVRQTSLSAKFSAFGVFKGALSDFQDSLAALGDQSTFGQRAVTSSNEAVVTATLEGEPASSTYQVSVNQLAESHSLASGAYASVSDTVGTGTLTFRFGTTDYTPPDSGPESYDSFTLNPERQSAAITIDSSNNTLEGMRDAINEADIGVAAVIVNDGSGFRLLLNSEFTGASNSLEVSVDDLGDGDHLDTAGLSALAFNAGATNLSQTVAAQDAQFTVNGLAITSASNSAEDVIDGVDLTLHSLSTGAPVSIGVSENVSALREQIVDFVLAYNTFADINASLTNFNADSNVGGILQGDFSARSIFNQVRQTLTNSLGGIAGPFQSLSELGITTDAQGHLSIDSERLDQNLEASFDEIAGLFAAVGTVTDPTITLLGFGNGTQIDDHIISISQLATQGQLIGGVVPPRGSILLPEPPFPIDIDADNDELTISVNGISSSSIVLTQANYATGEDLAAELQARLNEDSALIAADATVLVVFNGDHFEFTSEQYGSESQVEITALDTNSAELGLSVAAGQAGLDVAGSIGGISATGQGQVLSAGITGPAAGVQLLVTGGNLGVRGALEFSRGVAQQLNLLIGGFLDDNGILESRTDGIQERLDEITDSREVLNRRMESVEARYRAQFTALDTLLAQLQTTSTFLAQQLDALPRAGSLNNRNNN